MTARRNPFAAPAAGGLRASRIRRTQPADAPPAAEKQEGPVVELQGAWDESTPAIDWLKACPSQSQSFREGEYVHVSDALSKCMRKVALVRRLKAKHPSERIMDGQGLTFAMGDAIHDYIKARFIKGHPDKVWALWSCACGDTSIGPCVFSKRGRKTTCPKCETEIDRHNEVPMADDEFMVSGRPDLVLWLAEYGAFYIIEIKSMAGEKWKELVRPMPDHVMQALFYWWLKRRNKKPVIAQSSILYASKEFMFKLPYKEMIVRPDTLLKRLDPYLEDLAAVKAAGGGGPLPIRSMCASMDSPEAKKCPVCVACFAEGRA